MKRKIIKYGIIGLVVIILLFGYLIYQGPDAKNEFTEKDLLPVSFNSDNGFYKLLTLFEPENVNVDSKEVIDVYRNLCDVKDFKNNEGKIVLTAEHIEKAKKKEKDNFQKNSKKLGILMRIYAIYHQTGKFAREGKEKKMLDYFLSRKKEILTIKRSTAFLLERYYKLINSEKVEDFLPIDIRFPTFNLIGGGGISELFKSENIIMIGEGKWDSGIKNILKELSFYHKLIKSARTGYDIPSIQIGKGRFGNYHFAGIQLFKTYGLLNRLMNLDECPKYIYNLILKKLPAGEKREFLSQNKIISSAIAHLKLVDKYNPWAIYVPKNRIKNYYINCYKEFINLDKIIPYKRKITPEQLLRKQKARKRIAFDVYNPNLEHLASIIYPTYSILVINDLTRLSAELKSEYDPKLTLKRNIEKLNSYSATDPFSGKPYKYKIEDQMVLIYSYGENLKDDKCKNSSDSKYCISYFSEDIFVKIELSR